MINVGYLAIVVLMIRVPLSHGRRRLDEAKAISLEELGGRCVALQLSGIPKVYEARIDVRLGICRSECLTKKVRLHISIDHTAVRLSALLDRLLWDLNWQVAFVCTHETFLQSCVNPLLTSLIVLSDSEQDHQVVGHTLVVIFCFFC